jgi:hypothetical protein
MSKSEQFRQYAEEALRWSFRSKTETEKQSLIELARTWTLAASLRDTPMIVTPEHRVPRDTSLR